MNNSTSQHSLLSGWRIAFYGFALLWIFLQPTFVRASEHFGPGLLPLMASWFIVPLILAALVGNLLLRLIDAFSSKAEAVRIRLIRVSIPALLLTGSLYWLLTRPSALDDLFN